MELRKDYLAGEPIDTIYFGGGTPTLLHPALLEKLLEKIRSLFPITDSAEITLEANPDDITPNLRTPNLLTSNFLTSLQSSGVNRLSLGLQSFFNDHLTFMNRRHDARQAESAVYMAAEAGFSNISIDLIYGIPGMTMEQWAYNLHKANELPAVHLSAYHLTIEPGTRFGRMRKAGLFTEADDADSIRQYSLLRELTEAGGYEQYEISNFARNKLYSRHNSKYWTGEGYIGFGPSAHSFSGTQRHWNPSSIKLWMQQTSGGTEPKGETVTPLMQRNEYVMTRLRTSAGIEKEDFRRRFGESAWNELMVLADSYLRIGELVFRNNRLWFDPEAWFRSDGILSALFV
jgi:oxygen-independent coproporphyrinogen-3 oxidase